MQKVNVHSSWAAVLFLLVMIFAGCNKTYKHPLSLPPLGSSVIQAATPFDSSLIDRSDYFPFTNKIYTNGTQPAEVLTFARSLIGTPYIWGATDPAVGFDCSGFITYVFNHFGMQVPRSSLSFANIETDVPLTGAQPGDLILFTGTDSATLNTIGHMGIIESNNNSQVTFIHASSGKAMGVTTSPLDAFYRSRFVKLIRIFPQPADAPVIKN